MNHNVIDNILYSFCDSGTGYKEQDFLSAVFNFIPGDSKKQKKAQEYILAAIKQLNMEDEEHANKQAKLRKKKKV